MCKTLELCALAVFEHALVFERHTVADRVKALARCLVGPFPHKAFATEVKKYPNLVDVVWCQDEPQNQGAWFFIQHNIHENMSEGQKLGYAGRAASASPAVGYAHLHQEQLKSLLDQAFGKLKGFVLTK